MNWARSISEVVEVPDLGDTPAAVNRKTGVVYINARLKGQLTKDQWFFILLHEQGHLVLQTTDEKAVDAWAFDEYVKRGYKLSESVYALTKVLNFSTPEHFERAENQLKRAQQYDNKISKFSGMSDNKAVHVAQIALAGSILAVLFMPKITGKGGFGMGVVYWVLGGLIFGTLGTLIFKDFNQTS